MCGGIKCTILTVPSSTNTNFVTKLSKFYAPVAAFELLGNDSGRAVVGEKNDGSDFISGGSVDTGDVKVASFCLCTRKSNAACCQSCS